MSNKDPWYRQCTYETFPSADGSKREGTSWIPETLSKVGKRIYFGERTPNPEVMWTVTHVGERQRESVCVASRTAHKYQRRQSDI